ncbi:MAG: glycosyltransferase family 2 protein [Caldilineaceae bacterium]
MIMLATLVTLALTGLLCIAVTNALTFPRLHPSTEPLTAPPRVSVLIPARNEAANIARTVRALLTQTYPHFEVLVLDDHSDDNTGALALVAANGDPRLRVQTGAPLPSGWAGKNWACHQLAQQATGEILVFTDADVNWAPEAVAAVVTELQRTHAGLLTVWPTQITVTWGERLVVPLIAFAVLAYLPITLAHRGPWPLAAAANGQCMAFRHAAYEKCGGHASVRGEVVEDVLLAQQIKAVGLPLRMADGAGLLQTRMYHDWRSTLFGYAKNILAGHGKSVSLLFLSTLFHLTLFVGPWLWLALGWLGFAGAGWPLWPLLLIMLGVGIRALTAFATHQRLADSLLMPLSVLLMTRIAGQAVWWQWRYGGPRWKGRIIGSRQEGLGSRQ